MSNFGVCACIAFCSVEVQAGCVVVSIGFQG